MTRNEILNMPVSRELDVLIAEKVFGCNVRRAPSGAVYCNCERVTPLQFAPHGDLDLSEIYDYSTDDAAAWGVVEGIRDRFAFAIKESEDTEGWDACFFGRGANVGHWQAYAETAPLAICRAALLAVSDL